MDGIDDDDGVAIVKPSRGDWNIELPGVRGVL